MEIKDESGRVGAKAVELEHDSPKTAEGHLCWQLENKDKEITEEFSDSMIWSFKKALSHATFLDFLLLLLAVNINSWVPILIDLSKDEKTKETLYSSYFLTGCQEFLKCFVSFIAFCILCAKEKRNFLKELQQLTFKHWCYFFFASACYAGINNIDIKVINFMDPATFQIISRFRLLTTTAIWWLIFRVRINKFQLFALFMIVGGTCIIVLPKLWEKKSRNENEVGFSWHGIYLLAIEFIFHAAGSISTEWVLKRDIEMSIWVQGVCMYSWGALINFMLYAILDRERAFVKKENPFHYFNTYGYLLILGYCVFGLTIGIILKRFSTVVKMICSSFANIETILLTYFILNKKVNVWFISGACVIICAVAVYGYGAQKEKDRVKKLKLKEEEAAKEKEEKKNEDEIDMTLKKILKIDILPPLGQNNNSESLEILTTGGSDPDISGSS